MNIYERIRNTFQHVSNDSLSSKLGTPQYLLILQSNAIQPQLKHVNVQNLLFFFFEEMFL